MLIEHFGMSACMLLAPAICGRAREVVRGQAFCDDDLRYNRGEGI